MHLVGAPRAAGAGDTELQDAALVHSKAGHAVLQLCLANKVDAD